MLRLFLPVLTKQNTWKVCKGADWLTINIYPDFMSPQIQTLLCFLLHTCWNLFTTVDGKQGALVLLLENT